MKSIILFAALAVAVVSAAPQQAKQENTRTSCTPGASWNDGCNTCTCMPSGGAACTQVLCEHTQLPVLQAPGGGASTECVAGSWWMPDDCNTCHCNQAGTAAACTLMGCLPRTKPAPADRKECSPDAVFEKEGKSCTCTAEGKASCSPRTRRSEGSCTPGDSWKEDCNSCRCTPGGQKACSKMFCPKAPEPEQQQPQQ